MVIALSNHCTVAWVTRPEWPKGAKDEVKQALGPNAGPKGRKLEVGAQRAPRLLVCHICQLPVAPVFVSYRYMYLCYTCTCVLSGSVFVFHLYHICWPVAPLFVSYHLCFSPSLRPVVPLMQPIIHRSESDQTLQ